MINENEYRKALEIICEYRSQQNLPIISEFRFVCDCGCGYFNKIETLKDKKSIKFYGKNPKHLYKCENCSKEWWSFFYKLDTENHKLENNG